MELEQVRAEIARMRAAQKTYEYIGNIYGVNKGIIHRILNDGYEPKDKEIRKRLGLDGEQVNFIRQVRTPNGKFIKGR